MEGLERAEIKDNILSYLNEFGKSSKTDFSGQYKGGSAISNFESVFEELLGSGYIETVSLTKDSHRVKITYNGEKILESGGFVVEYENTVEVNRKFMEAATIDGDIKKLQVKNLELTNKLNNRKLKTHYVPIIVSLVSLAIAAYSLLKPSDSVSQEVLDTKVESLEGQIKQLEKDLKKENGDLKDRLYKAELLIAVYEEE